MEMYDFFYRQLTTLKARTGFNQWDKLQESKDPLVEINAMIGFMIDECNKPPFDKVEAAVKQRVIDRAVVEDNDFIGMNAKFVKRALNTWWLSNGDRILEKLNAKEASVYDRVELTPEQNEKVNVMINSYVARLLQGDGPRMIPKVDPEVAVEEGKEWKSDLERKAINYPVTSMEAARANELHREWIRQNFDKYTADKLPTWKPENEWIESLSESEKVMIFNRAVK